MASIGIVGDGPGGLSAGLFLAKNGHEVTVYGQNKTAVNFAYLYNYLGILEINGPDFQATALRQVESFGGQIRDEEVTSLAAYPGLTVTTATDSVSYGYLVLTEGQRPHLARSLGVETDEAGAIVVDRDYKTSLDRVYVVGRSVRPTRSQVIISAGAGATAALDILAIEAGSDIQDWDSPPDDGE